MFKKLLTFCAVSLLSMGSFAAIVEDFKKDWTIETGYPYYKVDDKATYEIEDGALKVTYPTNEDGSQAWSQYFIADWMNLTEGYTYTVKFYAKATEACTVDVLVGSWGSAGKATGVAIGTEWSEISCTVKDGVPSSTANDLHVLIQGGRGPIYYQWVTVSHDDSEAVEKEPEPEIPEFVLPAGEIIATDAPWYKNTAADGAAKVYELSANGDGRAYNVGKEESASYFGCTWGGENLNFYADLSAYSAIKIYQVTEAPKPRPFFFNTDGTARTGSMADHCIWNEDGKYYELDLTQPIAGVDLTKLTEIRPTGKGIVIGITFVPKDIETAISSVNATENGAAYNLAGQHLVKMQKGINIVGGKKVVIK